MLSSVGRPASLLRHGAGREAYHLVVLKVSDADVQAFAKELGAVPPTVRAGPRRYLALPLEKGAAPGSVDAKYYSAEDGRWTATVAIQQVE